MESVYKFFIGPINAKTPSQSFKLQITLLKYMGLWEPDTDDPKIKILYTIWSYFYRFTFQHFYTVTQMLYFMDVEDVAGVAKGFFLLLTQISLCYKVEKFYGNRHRIRACEKILRSTLFLPQNEEEDKFVGVAMVSTFVFGMSFLIGALGSISSWSLSPFFDEHMSLPIAAWYPIDYENSNLIFGLLYIFQIYGICMSAFYNVSTDTFASGIMSHANAQVQRLGLQISKIGYENDEFEIKRLIINDIDLKIKKVKTSNLKKNLQLFETHIDDQMMEILEEVDALKAKHGEHYGEVIKCIIYHKHILTFAEEIQNIFKGPIFAQIMASSIIICMTLVLFVNQSGNIMASASSLVYLVTMVIQILLFCWVGNEIIYSSYQLAERAYFSNFLTFNLKAMKALLIFMIRVKRDLIMIAGGIFEFHLDLATFMAIMKSSYSYFAVLNSME